MLRNSLLAVTAALCTVVFAQTAFADNPPLAMVGVGVAVPLSGSVGGTVYVPINLMDKIRIEPGIGLVNASKESKGTTATTKSSASAITLTIGALYMMRPAETFVGYVGPRLGVVMNSGDTDNGTVSSKSSHTDILASLVIGGEHFFSPRFSLGAEAAVGIAMIGQTTTTVTPAPATPDTVPTETQSVMSTGGTMFARMYF